MKKLIKSISVFVLSLSLAFSGIVFNGNVKADAASDWKANAVKTPTEGSLIGAGYVDVEFDNSLSGYTYEVLLDGNSVYWKDGNILRPELGEDTSAGQVKTFTSGVTQKTEVYTTEVASHQITVKATSPDNQSIISDPVTFYVSKKGLAMGDNMGDKVSLSKLNCSWYYNWGTNAFNNSVDGNVSHVPMMWGGYEDSIEDIKNLNTTSNYILGFNEPDIESQANMGFWDGVDVWKQNITPLTLRKVSPAPAAPFGNSSWLEDFMEGEYICLNNYLNDGSWGLYTDYYDEGSKTFKDGVGDDVDSVCLHYYRNVIDPDGIITAVDRLWNKYHKPVWITEIGLFGMKGTVYDMSYELEDKRAEIQNYLQGIVSKLDAKPYVERYCWFPYDVESKNDIDAFDGSGATAMFEYASGKYTELGRMYSQIGNPSTYTANTISDSEMFNWDERITKEAPTGESTTNVATQVTTTKAPTTQVSTTQRPTTKPTVAPTEKQTTNAPATVAPSQEGQAKPGKASLSKAKNIKKKSVKLSWKKTSGADKYKVQWALNKKFNKNCKSKIVSTVSYKVTKLKKKKTYFFRIAAMNSVGIGPWSNVKKVKIKK